MGGYGTVIVSMSKTTNHRQPRDLERLGNRNRHPRAARSGRRSCGALNPVVASIRCLTILTRVAMILDCRSSCRRSGLLCMLPVVSPSLLKGRESRHLYCAARSTLRFREVCKQWNGIKSTYKGWSFQLVLYSQLRPRSNCLTAQKGP